MEQSLAAVLEKIIKEKELYLKRGIELTFHPTQSDTINEISAALSKAQGEFSPLAKNTKGYNYKYTELACLLTMVIPILSNNQLAFTQYMTKDNILHTRISHSSGQWIESQFQIPMPSEKEFNETSGKKTSYMQEIGCRRTYARRYEALAILGIHPEGDDTDATKGF